MNPITHPAFASMPGNIFHTTLYPDNNVSKVVELGTADIVVLSVVAVSVVAVVAFAIYILVFDK